MARHPCRCSPGEEHRRDVRLGARCAAAICGCTSFCRICANNQQHHAGWRGRGDVVATAWYRPPTTARQRRSAQRLSEHREKQLKAQGGAKVRSRITRLLGIALRNLRRARVVRVHTEWQRLEAAAVNAAEAAAERERAFRSRCVHTAQTGVCGPAHAFLAGVGTKARRQDEEMPIFGRVLLVS